MPRWDMLDFLFRQDNTFSANQMAEFQREILKSDFMLKRSQMKGKFKSENYRSRWFQLTSTVLRYCDGSIETGPSKVKGQIELSQVTAVEETDAEALGNRPNAFQVVYKTGDATLEEMCTLYVIAVFEQQRTDWIDKIRKACQSCGSEFSHRFHPGVWMVKGAKYSCCESINKRTFGCQPTTCTFVKSSPMKNSCKINNCVKENSDNAAKQAEDNFGYVLALYDYKAAEENELDLTKGDQYKLLEEFDADNWLKVKNIKGRIGVIPASYVQLVGSDEDSLEEHEWFYTNTSRMQSEGILEEDGRDGSFMVRDSSQKGVYTLSVLKKSNPNDPGTVKHYHIKLLSSSGKYYLTDKHNFDTIPQLIYYHKHNSAGLIVRLRFPPKERMKPVAFPLLDSKEIDLKQLQFMEELGTGQFGKVVRGIYKKNIEVAIKTMKEGTMSEDDFIDEAKTMVKLNHPNLVKLYGVSTTKKPILIITEYMKNGALLHYLKRNKHHLLNQVKKLLDMSVQVSSAMQYLEEHSVIHRDLAARNCLVGDNVVKVADFGLARHVLDNEYMSSFGAKFPVRWSAPEVLAYTKFSNKSDVWAFGILMWEIFTCGELPYGKSKNPEIVESVCNRNRRLSKPENCSQEVFRVMTICWKEDSDHRPNFVELHKDLQILTETDDYCD